MAECAKELGVVIKSIRKGCVSFDFDNGNCVSVIFGPGSYTDNHDLSYSVIYDKEPVSSTEVEIMVSGPMTKWFKRKYEVNPAGYLNEDELFTVLAYARRQKVKGNITASKEHQDE